MNAINAGIVAIGRYVPPTVLTNAELETMVDTTDAWIQSRIGVQERHIAAPEQLSSDLAVLALSDACRRAGIDPSEIDLVISGSNTPDHPSPQTACMILRKAGLDNCVGFDVRAGGCAGSIFALDVGAQYITSGRYHTVAVVLAEVNSKITNWNDRSTCVILGDGAACYILRPCRDGSGIVHTTLGNEPSGYFAAYVPNGGRAQPVTPSNYHDGRQYFVMDGHAVWDFAHQDLPAVVRKVARDSGVGLDQADVFITHQANRRIIHDLMELIGQPRDKAFVNIERLGNTSSASVPLALCEAIDIGRIHPGSMVFCIGFGAGLSYGVSVMRWCAPEDFLPPHGGTGAGLANESSVLKTLSPMKETEVCHV
ncbi:3-oxoacyl-[acyl-carrier-protein] synthase III [Propionibacterium sp. oral taxon 192 str. F0372]|uniref:3-oxoacyl-ACP synthase III family protein n=1 Tax=Propionibacterium sp. oral taxon 192 TaxID=671222 RepID=UPI000353DC06|nr:beta-ketoacyl-ACP synthase III [Propionibacterium sp. oral taxon 192]EPH05593.1 3-oxoacyl-[acyl-carrier-protein] synthase III [Propionibacterium sp. oral taxon 192 str. F0372]